MNKSNFLWNFCSFSYNRTIKNSVAHLDQFRDVSEALHLNNGLKILDVGCGTGDLEKFLYEKNKNLNFNVTAVDFSLNMIKNAKKKNKGNASINFIHLNANNKLDFAPQYFDRVVLVNVFFALDKKIEIVKNFQKILKNDGLLIIVDPKPDAKMVKTIPYFFKKVAKTKLLTDKIKLLVKGVIMMPFAVVVLLLNYVMVLWSRQNTYHFYSSDDFVKMLRMGGFNKINISETLANQDWLITARK